MSRSLQELYGTSPLFGANAPYVEALYEAFLDDPASVPAEWREYFEGLRAGVTDEVAHGPVKDAILSRSLLPRAAGTAYYAEAARKQAKRSGSS